MSAEGNNAIKAEGFAPPLDCRGSPVVVSMRRNADMTIHEKLRALFRRAGSTVKAVDANAGPVRVRGTLLHEFLFPLIAPPIHQYRRRVPPSQQYLVKFRSNSNRRWQQESLEALRAYAQIRAFIE